VEECRTLIEWLDPRPRERILDVGCGDGFYDHAIAGSGAHVLGIDINEQRLAVAHKRNAHDRAEFRFMDAEEMDLAADSFDKVVSFCFVEHFPRDQQVLGHIRRVLRPGGRLFISADSLSNPEITEAERAAHRRRYSVNTFYTADVLREKVRTAGLELEETEYILTTPLTLALARLSWRLDDLSPPLLPLKALGYLALLTVGTHLPLSPSDWPREPTAASPSWLALGRPEQAAKSRPRSFVSSHRHRISNTCSNSGPARPGRSDARGHTG
jgi:2-polyprenyl-3-methyl-5-hydroxy-6-metoxy-1,4-benzoquinol methylase